MIDESILKRLASSVTPSDNLQSRLKMRIQNRIAPLGLQKSAQSVVPSSALRTSLKQRVLAALGQDMKDTAENVSLSGEGALSLRKMILGRLVIGSEPSFVHSGFKWAASFAVFLLLIRAMPLVLLAPTTKADIGVQLIPNGEDVSVFVGGVWRSVESPEVISGPLMIRTGDSRATVILNDDGVVRLEPNTTFKLHDIGDRPQFVSAGPTATLVRGQIWVLGLLPPVVESISIETTQGQVEINSGSASLSEDGQSMTIAVYDRGVTFHQGNQTAFLVSGEKGISYVASSLSILSMPPRAFTTPVVSQNLQQDAVHRAEIGKLQQERRERMAGILPTSILYSAKRIAEEVDVLFTLTHDGRTEKRIAQADTRLSEALALIKEGQNTEAAVPLSEYSDSLVAMASGTGDNLVKYLIKKQIADASISIAPSTSSGKIQMLRTAVLGVSAAIPDTALQSRDIEGYVLVDRLTAINHTLLMGQNLTGALLAYSDISPYIKSLLAEKGGAHPLLQKEAVSLLVSTSSLLKEAAKGSQNNIIVAAQNDLDQYLPPEQNLVLMSEAKLDETIEGIVKRILIFKAPLSRYNQLILEMSELRGNPDRGTLLRRLYRAVPENGLGGYVLTEIKNFGDELKSR